MQCRPPSILQLQDALLDKLLEEHGRKAGGIAAPLLLQRLTDGARQALEQAGMDWIPTSDVAVQAGSGLPLQLKLVGFRRIDVTVNVPTFVQQCLQIGESEPGTDLMDMGRGIVQASVALWAAHYDHCPLDAWRHERLCEAAAEGGFGTTRVLPTQWNLATAVACFFERNIVVRILTRKKGAPFAKGILLEHHLNKRGMDLLTDLFFRGQSVLAPDAWKDTLNQYVLPEHPLAKGLLPELLPVAFGVRLRRVGGELRVRCKPDGEPQQREWADRVYQLAALLIPYLEEPSSQQKAPYSHPFGTPELPPGPRTGVIPDTGPISDSQGDRTPASPETSGGGPRPDRSNPPPRRLDFDSLDRYYSQRAAVLPVEAEIPQQHKCREPDLVTIGFLDSERADLRALASGPIDWFGLRVTWREGRKELVPRLRTEPLEVPLGSDGLAGVGPPHLLLVVDSSGSMKFDPRAADPAQRGKYDVVLAACYGMFAHLGQFDAADDVRVACINYSRNSLESGWHAFREIGPVKRVLLQYQGGGTRLDPDSVDRAFASRPAPFLAVMITDGCLANVAEAAAALERTVHAGCELVLLHVGTPNAFTEAIRTLGRPVHILESPLDLIGLSLRIARGTYRASPA
jgi:hypothetical protein